MALPNRNQPSVYNSDEEDNNLLRNYVLGEENDETNSNHEIPVQENNEENSNQNLVENSVHKCARCAKTFKLPHHLKRHIEAVHDKKKSFKCRVPSCRKSFTEKANLKQHIEGVHQGKKPYNCEICNRSYTKRHMKAHKARTSEEMDGTLPRIASSENT